MNLLKTVLCVMVVCFIACKETPERPDAILDQNYEPTAIEGAATTPTTAVPPATPGTPEPAQNAAGVWHYTCPTGCAGGGAAASPCATCGTTLVHNQLYHNNGAAPATATTPITPTGAPAGTPPTPATPEPAQNAAGVWHYTCSNGCAGGAGSAIACAGCGNVLAHNPVYHQ